MTYRKQLGTRKFVCAECGGATMLHWTARARHTRPKCQECGSYALDPSPSSKAKDDILIEGECLLLRREAKQKEKS
jgi:transposase-like protein